MQKCNSNGQCSCDVGFGGSTCQTPVSGPGLCLQCVYGDRGSVGASKVLGKT